MYNDVQLSNDMYLGNEGFTKALEYIDPTPNYSNSSLVVLDAYERQLKRYDIRITDNDKRKSCLIRDFFKDKQSAVLFPEFINRLIKKTYNLDKDIFEMSAWEFRNLLLKENKIMETMSTTQQIERLEKELAELRKQEQIEKEEVAKKVAEERDKDLSDILNSIKAFNEKYNEYTVLVSRRPPVFRDCVI